MKVKYFDLKNKNVFITGGGSGIGASIVEHFCEQECDVYFVDINKKESNKLIKNLKKKGLKAPHFIECNLIKIKKLQTIIQKIIKSKGPIDILINNAANDDRHSTDQVDEKYWNNRMDVNLSSVSWMLGEGDKVAYETAKSAVIGLTRSFAREFGKYNIRCNSVTPGSIATERQIKHWLTPKYKKFILDKQCLKRQLKPDDVASLVVHLSSDVSSGCTKQNFIIDAGIT